MDARKAQKIEKVDIARLDTDGSGINNSVN